MNWRCALGRVLQNGVLVRGVGDDLTHVCLVEKDLNVHMQKHVFEIPDHAAVLSMENVGHLNCVEGPKLQWKCDYMIFADFNGQDYVVLIELKKKLKGSTRAFAQLCQTVPIAEYLAALARGPCAPATSLTRRMAVLVQEATSHVDKLAIRGAGAKPVRVEEWKGEKFSVFKHDEIRFADLIA